MKRILLPVAIGAVTASLWWAFAQPAPAPLASLFPAGAVLYLEAKDAGALVRDWDASAEKTSWTQSSNYGSFSRSQLYLRLADAQTEFASAAGVPADYALFNSVAGGNSAIAMYDIGKLEFLYITRLPSARALNTTLWKSRGSYQTRRAGGVDYYLKEDPAFRRTAVFAYAGDLLLLGTRQDALAGALELIARVNRPSVASEPWFQSATQAAAPGDRDLRLVYNMDHLVQTHQFRSHWIQNNTAALREFSSGLADLERTTAEFRERRVLLRSNASPDGSTFEPRAGQLLALAPDDAGLYRLWSRPDSTTAAHWIEEKIFSATAAPAVKRENAPGASESGDAGSESDLEIRIDETPLSDARSTQAFETLRAQLNPVNLDAMLEVSSTSVQPDQVFVQPHAALVLLASTNWDANQIRAALTSAANGLWTSAGLGAGWRAGANGAQELDGLGKIVLVVDGQKLIVSDSVDLVNSILARRNRPAASGATYEASWRHSRELPNFDRMMRLMDFPQIHAPDAADNTPTDNSGLFYSQNISSLGHVLGRVDSATITVHDLGAMLRENVVYRLRP
jgi:hypothetical protein